MRIKLKDKEALKQSVGRTRVVEKFLFFPKLLDNEIRWLERSKILQMVLAHDVGGSMEWGKYKYKWVDIEWTEES